MKKYRIVRMKEDRKRHGGPRGSQQGEWDGKQVKSTMGTEYERVDQCGKTTPREKSRKVTSNNVVRTSRIVENS